MITSEQIDWIDEQISSSKIDNEMLRDDLLDHFCCLIEIEMNQGLGFEKAYQKAFLQTAPNGLDEIQRETIFLLNSKRIIAMKQVTYITGFLFSLAFTVGIVFKFLHFMGAGLLLFCGAVGLIFIFIPLLFINHYKAFINQAASEKARYVIAFLSTSLFILGALLKVLHLPGAAVILAVGGLLFGFGFLPFLFFRMYKKSLDHI